ncbi:MAG: hypothetical protein R3C03_00120 [Pirellulaceae bacterium]
MLSKGAAPTLFTFAMLGELEATKSMLEFSPEMRKLAGPHGINLMRHAEIGFGANGADKAKSQRLIDYLNTLDLPQEQFLEMTADEKQLYLGNYMFGPSDEDGFTIQLNMRELLSLGRIGKFGGALYKSGNHRFAYNGAPSVTITFHQTGNRIDSLKIVEPGMSLIAKKVS